MSREELMIKLQEQITKVDMALMTASTNELVMLETLRTQLSSQLDMKRTPATQPLCA